MQANPTWTLGGDLNRAARICMAKLSAKSNTFPSDASGNTMKQIARATLFLLVAVCLPFVPRAFARQGDTVSVAAGADQDYVREKFGEAGRKPKAESYLFAKGSRFGGHLRDPSLETFQFSDVVRALAPDLAKQLYYPAADKNTADLLIVVHWGITTVDEDASNGQADFENLMKDVASHNAAVASGGIADPSAVEGDLNMIHGESNHSSTGPANNADLLGYSAEYQRAEYDSLGVASGMTELDKRLREDLVDERYFVILMAYDFNSMKNAKKGTKPKLLWSTHFSIRAIGMSFNAALPAMSKVAANYFGHNVDGLLLGADRIHEGKVEVGEIKQIDSTR
jgi:hypothetical protein